MLQETPPSSEAMTMTHLEATTMTHLEATTMTHLEATTMTHLEARTMTHFEARTMTHLLPLHLRTGKRGHAHRDRVRMLHHARPWDGKSPGVPAPLCNLLCTTLLAVDGVEVCPMLQFQSTLVRRCGGPRAQQASSIRPPHLFGARDVLCHAACRADTDATDTGMK
jgi:hypothetical protein